MLATFSGGGSADGGVGEQIFIIVVAALIVAVVTWVVRRVSKREAMRTKDMQEVKSFITDVRSALITEPATPFNPYPQKKLVDRVNELWKSHFELKKTVERMDRRAETIKEDTTALVHDSKTNQGESQRDAIDRIEMEQGRVRTELTERDNRDPKG